MTRNQIILEDLVELINEHGGIDSFSQALSQLMDRAMVIERADVLGAEPYQRTDTSENQLLEWKKRWWYEK